MSHVFVSYARADQERVRRYVECLESAGFLVRWDDDLRGQPFDAQLKQWISDAGAIVIFWSLTSIGRNFVQAELNHADIDKVISVRIDPIDPQSIPLKANTLNIIDLSIPGRSGISDGILKLIARCAELTGSSIPPLKCTGTGRPVEAQEKAPPAASISVVTNTGVVATNINGSVKTGR